MKVMIVCRETQSGGSGERMIRAIIEDNLRETDDALGNWTTSTFRADNGTGLYLISGSSAGSAVLLADAIRRSGNNFDVDLWQELDHSDLLLALFP